MPRRLPAVLLSACLFAPSLHAQDPIRAENLRTRLFALADDSMMGRDPGTRGGLKATDYVAAEFKRLGLKPAGDGGSYFQTVPLGRVAPDTTTWLEADGNTIHFGAELLPYGQNGAGTRDFTNVRAVYGGLLNDPATWLNAEAARGKLVILGLAPDAPPRGVRAVLGDPRLSGAVAIGAVLLDRLPSAIVAQMRRGSLAVGSADSSTGPMILMLSEHAASQLLGKGTADLAPGTEGRVARGHAAVAFRPFPLPARNVIAILPGRDPKLRATYVSISAHNDHVGLAAPVDHDSLRAFNRVVRPMGADSPERPATAEEQRQITVILDSLRRIHPPRRDSIVNGADDDGTGTVALMEIAGAISRMPNRPRRSILFVSHTAEELGLLGSKWFTDHPTVPRDSIVAEVDMDMIGRGDAADLPKGGVGYLEVIGSRRLSTEFGDTLEAVNARQPQPFTFNYEFDQPGHPLQYYCRADHYSYARYGIPATALSRGEHLDYHQVTDEPEYIDYEALARVARLVRDVAIQIGNMDHRPLVNGPHGDPKAVCRQ